METVEAGGAVVEVTIYTTRVCPYCHAAKRLLRSEGVEFREVSLDGRAELRRRLAAENDGWRTVPMVFIGGRFVGGYDDLRRLQRTGELRRMLGGEDVA